RDLYRLQVARSLLVIDLESCARCGHCAWACSEMYGVARLVRRGDKIVARVDGRAESEELCTGCGACAKACPWDNIQMAARPLTALSPAGGTYAEIAVKCDLCRGYE